MTCSSNRWIVFIFCTGFPPERGGDYPSCAKWQTTFAAEKIVLEMDNLNTHREASLYEAFAPETALALCERFKSHHPPRHGSWLNMAEIGCWRGHAWPGGSARSWHSNGSSPVRKPGSS